MPGSCKGEFFSHLLLFARRLKEKGLKITTGRITDALRSLQFIDFSLRQDFAAALQANFTSSREDQLVFQKLFEEFFGQDQEDSLRKVPLAEEEADAPGVAEAKLLAVSLEGESPNQDEEVDAKVGDLSYSPHEVLMVKDFSCFPPEETRILEQEFSRILSRLAKKMSRRREPSGKGQEVDFRRTLRRTVRHGGEVLEWVRRRRKIKPLKVIIICDVSGSMDSSTRFILQFFFAMQKAFRGSETFVFSTRLTRITDTLKRKKWAEALQFLSKRVEDWSGGTQIGKALGLFNDRYARFLASGSAVVILVSDGWDRGDPEVLAAELGRLKRKTRRLIWMNPLMGTPGYRPLCQGMRTALPYVDDFLPANTLKGLQAMGDFLADLAS